MGREMTGSMKAFGEEQAERCRRVDWKVRRGRRGYTATSPTGATVTWHMTPSDTNAEKAILLDLRRAGLDRAELAADRRRDRDRAATLAMAVKANAVKTAKIAKQAASVKRAAAAYGPTDEFDLTWLLTKHKQPTVRQGVITPEIAEKLLTLNTNNRRLKPVTLRRVSSALVDGRYLLTHEALCICSNGELLDGQNRLTAIVETGVAAHMFVFVGMDPEIKHVIGQGVSRSGGDTLYIAGVPNANRMSTIVRTACMYEQPFDRWSKFTMDNDEVMHAYAKDPGGYQDAHRDAEALLRDQKGALKIPILTVASAIYLIRKDNPPRVVADYLDGLHTGAPHGDPRKALLHWSVERFGDGKRRSYVKYEPLAMVILSWNAWLAGNRVTRLHWPRDVDFPRVAQRR